MSGHSTRHSRPRFLPLYCSSHSGLTLYSLPVFGSCASCCYRVVFVSLPVLIAMCIRCIVRVFECCLRVLFTAVWWSVMCWDGQWLCVAGAC